MFSLAFLDNTGQFAVLGVLTMLAPFMIVWAARIAELRDPTGQLSQRQKSWLLRSFGLCLVAAMVVTRIGVQYFHTILATIYAMACMLLELVAFMMVWERDSHPTDE